MDYMGSLSGIVSIVSFMIFAAGVMKVFQMAATLSEIKDILASNKLNASVHSAAGSSMGLPIPISAAQSGGYAFSLHGLGCLQAMRSCRRAAAAI